MVFAADMRTELADPSTVGTRGAPREQDAGHHIMTTSGSHRPRGPSANDATLPRLALATASCNNAAPK